MMLDTCIANHNTNKFICTPLFSVQPLAKASICTVWAKEIARVKHLTPHDFDGRLLTAPLAACSLGLRHTTLLSAKHFEQALSGMFNHL